MRLCVCEEAGCGEHFEDGRGVYRVSVRIRPEWGCHQTEDTIPDPINSLFASTCTIFSTRKRVSSSPLTPVTWRLFYFDVDVQRCDAKRPCTPCFENKRSEECADKRGPPQHEAKKSRPTGAIRSPALDKSEWNTWSTSFSQLTGEDLSLFSWSLAPSDTSGSASSSTDSTLSRVSSGEHRVPAHGTPSELGPRTPREGSVSEIVLHRGAAPIPRDRTFATASPIFIHPFVRLPSIPRGPQIPALSFIDPELLQVSDTTSLELDLSLFVFPLKLLQPRVVCAESYPYSRLAALLHLKKLGIHLTGQKEEAIMHGDTSGDVVHPFFVHTSNAVGMHLRICVGDSPVMVRLHAKHAQRALEQISEAGKSGNMQLKAQMYLFAASACLFQRWFQPARAYLTEACDAVDAANLRFIPVSGRPPALTEEVQERLAVLSQIMYMENYLSLAIDQTPPTMTARIEEEFRHELQVGSLTPGLSVT
jgi:hypothetical protein